MFGDEAPALRIGRYEVVRKIGGGAQGDVYLARDPRLRRDVALKVLHHADATSRREARALAQLDHPNLVPVFEVGVHAQDGGTRQAFIVTEFVRGTPLQRWAQSVAADETRRLLQVLLGCTRALNSAHASGLVHADFKPSNVLVEQGDVPRVVDFGIASLVGALRPFEGTPNYSAPERLSGGEVRPELDQFALCTVAAELLASHSPSRRLTHVLARGRAHDPRDRHPSLAPVERALERELGGSSRPRVGLVFLAGAVALLATSLVFEQRRQHPCDAAAAAMDETWNAERETRVRERSEPAAAHADSAVTRWQQSLDGLCSADAPPPEGLACLESVRDDLDARLSFFERSEQVSVAFASLLDSEDPTACDASLALAPPPQTLLAAERSLSQGDRDEALRQLDLLLADERALPLVTRARLHHVRGRALRANRALSHATTAELELAFALGLRSGDDARASWAATDLAIFTADAGKLADANDWVLRARSAAMRSGDAAAMHRVHLCETNVAQLAGHMDEALGIATAAAADATGLLGAQLEQRACISYARLGRAREGVPWCERALQTVVEELGPAHPEVTAIEQSLAAALHGAGELERAKALLVRLIERQEAQSALQIHLLYSVNSLAIVSNALGDLPAASSAYARARKIFAELEDPPSDLGEVLDVNSAGVAVLQERWDEAERLYHRALVATEARLGTGRGHAMMIHWALGDMYLRKGDYDDAVASLEQAETLAEAQVFSASSLADLWTLRAQALVRGQLDLDEGRALAEAALEVYRAEEPPRPEQLDQALGVLSELE